MFERLAQIFPRLAFDCACIEELDDFMGYGWFNAPPGGEPFAQDYAVPKDYWEPGGSYKRSAAVHHLHERRTAALRAAALAADRMTH